MPTNVKNSLASVQESSQASKLNVTESLAENKLDH